MSDTASKIRDMEEAERRVQSTVPYKHWKHLPNVSVEVFDKYFQAILIAVISRNTVFRDSEQELIDRAHSLTYLALLKRSS